MQPTTDTRLFIAVIDDSPTIRKILETCLVQQGYVVQSFPNAREAFHAFFGSEHPFPLPNILFVDLVLPGIDGYGVTQRFRREPNGGSDIHIIALTRKDSIIDRLLARVAGIDEYIIKPFTLETIVEAVQRYEREC